MDRFNGLDVPESLADAVDSQRSRSSSTTCRPGSPPVADRDRVLGNVLKLMAATRERGVRTVFTRHYFMPIELAGSISSVRQRSGRAMSAPRTLTR